MSTMLTKGSTTVKADGGMMIANKGSEFSHVQRRQRGRCRRCRVIDLHEGEHVDPLLL
jgi:hypothetical protein